MASDQGWILSRGAATQLPGTTSGAKRKAEPDQGSWAGWGRLGTGPLRPSVMIPTGEGRL